MLTAIVLGFKMEDSIMYKSDSRWLIIVKTVNYSLFHNFSAGRSTEIIVLLTTDSNNKNEK